MMPSSTGCEQSTVNFSVCLRFTTFFAFLIACARKGPRDLWRARLGRSLAVWPHHHKRYIISEARHTKSWIEGG